MMKTLKERIDKLIESISLIKGDDYDFNLKNDSIGYKWWTYKGKKNNQHLFVKKGQEIAINDDDFITLFNQDKRVWIKR